MKSITGMEALALVVLALGIAAANHAAELAGTQAPTAGALKAFKSADRNGDGYLSLDEFKAMGLDELAFKAADVNSDSRVDRDEYAEYLKARAADRAKSGLPNQPQPMEPPAR